MRKFLLSVLLPGVAGVAILFALNHFMEDREVMESLAVSLYMGVVFPALSIFGLFPAQGGKPQVAPRRERIAALVTIGVFVVAIFLVNYLGVGRTPIMSLVLSFAIAVFAILISWIIYLVMGRMKRNSSRRTFEEYE